MIRATTGGVLKSYRMNLMNSFITQNKAMETVLSRRTFNSYAEDPASAAKAFRLRKSRMTVQSQFNICNDTYHKYQCAFTSLNGIDNMIDTEDGSCMKTLKGTTLTMLNDPTGDAREQLAKALDQMSESIVQNMNQKYGDNFIFAGADGHNVPFEIKDNKLYYRGVAVDAAEPNVMKSEDGSQIVRVVNGQIDLNDLYGANAPQGTPVNYLKTDNLTLISKEEYAERYAMPNVRLDANGFPMRFDAEGNQIPELDPDSIPEGQEPEGTPEDKTIYYERLDANNASFDPPQFITTDQYNEEVANHNSPAPLLCGVDNTQNPPVSTAIEVDKDGVPTQGGGYYMLLEGDLETVSQEEYEAEKLEAEKLEYLSNEKLFVDIGLGFQENEDGKLIESSAFNAALNGINFLGYGVDADGDPKNIYSIVQRMKDIAESVPEGTDWDDPTYDEFYRLVGKLETASSEFKTAFTNMDAGTTKLENNLELLEDNFDNLQEQYMELEDVDMADAISSFLWAQYAYNAALKVGNSVLSQSLMDYLN